MPLTSAETGRIRFWSSATAWMTSRIDRPTANPAPPLSLITSAPLPRVRVNRDSPRALFQPGNVAVIGGAIALEQFGYGFGFTAYMVYMMLVAEGEHKTAHYAICTGFMALGMMLPGMGAGWLQDHLGYVQFFGWVCLTTLPSFVMTALLRIDPAYGRKAAPAAG